MKISRNDFPSAEKQHAVCKRHAVKSYPGLVRLRTLHGQVDIGYSQGQDSAI